MNRLLRAYRHAKSNPRRRGAMLVLVAFMLVIFVVAAVFMIDVAYMQLVRTELRAATDAAAKAGVERLAETQDATTAINTAITYASRNTVAGFPLTITADDIELGNSFQQPDGSWSFAPGQTAPNSVRVNSRMSNETAAGSVNLLLGSLLGRSTFTPQVTSTAAHYDQDICLVVDRSHSMCFDLSNVEWVYPPNTPNTPHSIFYPPNQIGSRWAALDHSIDVFLNIVEQQYWPPNISLVTWGSLVTLSHYEGNLTQQTAVAVTRDVPLGSDFQAVRAAITDRGNRIMLGSTHMSAGMEEGIQVLTGAGSRPYAKKTMILMTDGIWNAGYSPTIAARAARDANITIHTITFLQRTDQLTMQNVATITGGRHFHADDEASLREAFRELATNLPIVLTQ